ncbi:MAG: hypothetical protein K5668_07675 [Lachnospiraceae bacterium]|nr:hypothetical protein [Lachnospiraceae bacterium]
MLKRFFKKCPFLTLIIIITAALLIYGLLLSARVVKASNTVNLNTDPETVGVATAMQDIKARLSNFVEGIKERDYSVDYLPTEYVPDEDLVNTFGVDTSDGGKELSEEEKAAKAEQAERDAAAAAKRAERSEKIRNGEGDQFLKDAFKTKLPENDQSTPGDSYDGFYPVGNGYFTGGDTVIIGDSRQQGFGMYSGLDGIVSYAQKSYGVHQVFTKRWIDSPYGKLTLEEAMALNQGKFRKIYIMFGLNEMGWADENTFDNAYYQLIDMLKYYQPKAVIYVESIINVTKAKSTESNIFNNDNISSRNEALKVVAEKEHVAYLDINSVLTDDEGFLPDYYSSDGIHITQKYMYLWADFLKSHAVLSSGSDTQYVTGYTPEKDVSEIRSGVSGESEDGEMDDDEAEDNSVDDADEDGTEEDSEESKSDNIEMTEIIPEVKDSDDGNWETGGDIK